jgi:hypothetical protein
MDVSMMGKCVNGHGYDGPFCGSWLQLMVTQSWIAGLSSGAPKPVFPAIGFAKVVDGI